MSNPPSSRSQPPPLQTSRPQGAASAASAASSASKKINLNSPQAIFLAWTGLIFVAGYGYFTVKSQNIAKKKEFMLRQGQEAAAEGGTSEVGTGVQPGYTPGNNEKFQQSPLQSLTSAFTRQTDQRSRTREQTQ